MSPSVIYNLSMPSYNGFCLPGFEPGDLVVFDDDKRDSEIFVVVRGNFVDEIAASPRLCVLNNTGKICSYPVYWFVKAEDVQEA